ncbi:hypothetical protein [Dactylosporangium sp. NPDC005555]|uniref:WapI family immunity protein n=1 Tax=Dactylosporangium sp. NPDC005555 TaxID=3154889 RepID=UPI0033A22A42
MKLTSSDGATVELRPIAYQFGANPRAAPGTDWDANWLIVQGYVTASDATAWDFTDPCLTTWEARTVSAWLRGVVEGVIRPVAVWPDESWPPEPHFRTYTEPNLALSLQERTVDRATVRIHFSLEALPPGIQQDIYSYFLVLDLSLEELAAAAEEWAADCEPFPVR